MEEAHTTPNGKGKEADTNATPERPKINKQGRKRKQPDVSDSVPIKIYHKNKGRSERIFNQKMKKSGLSPNGEGSTTDIVKTLTGKSYSQSREEARVRFEREEDEDADIVPAEVAATYSSFTTILFSSSIRHTYRAAIRQMRAINIINISHYSHSGDPTIVTIHSCTLLVAAELDIPEADTPLEETIYYYSQNWRVTYQKDHAAVRVDLSIEERGDLFTEQESMGDSVFATRFGVASLGLQDDLAIQAYHAYQTPWWAGARVDTFGGHW
ncbi:hypothetical protein Tco_1216262 [Tanacetum coccineum]